MDKIQHILTALIAFCAVLSLFFVALFGLLNWTVSPLKEGQVRLETELKADIKDLKKSIQAIQTQLK